MHISKRVIRKDQDVYFVAELSANHSGNIETAIKTIEAAKKSGADAIKLQTYTAETMTLKATTPPFLVSGGTPWDGRSLFDLYEQAHTPWEWHPKLQETAHRLGLDFFSAAFDETAVDFLEKLKVPVHKVASFELTDLPLIRKMAATKKPLILSTGLASESEIEEAVNTARAAGCSELLLLKCTSAYPAPIHEANLLTIPHLETKFGCPVGLSDHTLGTTVPVVAASIGACLIEKHFILSREMQSPDNSFSLEPQEFAQMVTSVREAKKAMGQIHFGHTQASQTNIQFRRSLWITRPVKKGQALTKENVRSLRPSQGIAPKHLDEVLGRVANRDLDPGTALTWDDLSK